MSEIRERHSFEESIERAVREFQQGRNKEANFRLLMEAYTVPVARLLRRWVDLERDREDINQDVFLRVYHNLEGFEGASSFKTWLFTIARNTALRWLQARSRERHRELPFAEPADFDDGAGRPAEQLPAPEPSPLEGLLSNETSAELKVAIDGLPERMRDCLRRRLTGRSYQEIADELDVSIGTVKAHLFQAKARLFRTLGRDAPGLGGGKKT